MTRVLLVDDDRNLCRVIGYQLEKSGYEVTSETSGKAGLDKAKNDSYDVVITDIQMPDLNGIDLLREVRRVDPETVVIMITAYGSVDGALEACRLGADDYVTKPFSQEQLLFTLEKNLRLRRLQRENKELKHKLGEQVRFDRMVAHGETMQRLLDTAVRVAESDATVLILGESGTGKELLARGLHHHSPRSEGPFITVNCPAIPESLLESELFGHVKGAFTGALRDRAGKFEQANGGTVFLDEIGDLRDDLQAKLLRVIQERQVERLGASEPRQVDVRIIAATHHDLATRVREGTFRQDLYYRLSVIPLVLPPLRERPEDIPYLVDDLIRRRAGDRNIEIEDETLRLLTLYSWPGNVRELENVVERALILSRDNRITPQDLSAEIRGEVKHGPNVSSESNRPPELSLARNEERLIREALRRANGNQSEAARLLEIPRHVLLYRLKKYDLH
jgi:two-component system NtrC family response regulator